MSLVNVSEIIISKMQADDIEKVVEIEAEAYGEHHWSKSAFYDEMQNNLAKYYVAKTSDGKLVGYAGTWHIIDEGHITNIAIKKEFQGKGLSLILMNKLIEYKNENSLLFLTLEVRESNIPARSLYEKYNFKEVGRRKNYYENKENAVLYSLEG